MRIIERIEKWLDIGMQKLKIVVSWLNMYLFSRLFKNMVTFISIFARINKRGVGIKVGVGKILQKFIIGEKMII